MIEDEEQFNKQSARGFYGRRAGKGLRGRQAELMAAFDDHPATFQMTDTPPTGVSELFRQPIKSVWLESGFGGGEHLLHRAEENPDIGFIGVEPFRNGMSKALFTLEEKGFTNVALYAEEAGPLLDWLPANSIDGFYLLYPDPWPKKRHFKRRFVSQKNLERIARVLKSGADFRFASDISSYIDWTLDLCTKSQSFEWLDKDLENARNPWPNWPGTRYESKALKHGRIPHYLTFRTR